MSTQELLNTLSRYDNRRKLTSNRKKLLKIKLEKIAKIQNISKNELNEVKKNYKTINRCIKRDC